MIIIVMLLTVFLCSAKESEKWVKEPIEQVHMGNFSLPVSQQPGPLVAFGQNIVDKGNFQIFGYVNEFKGHNKNILECIPSFLYGITDKFSLFVEVPVAAKRTYGPFKSHGMEDLIAQLEGVVYAYETPYVMNAITIVANMSLPTGSPRKIPVTGLGSVSFLLGFTASRTKPDWYYFTSFGALLPTMYKNIKWGKSFLYEFGLSKNIAYKPDEWIFNWMVELDGFYTQSTKISGITNPDSGGNTVLFGPSLWFSTQRFIIQAGISAVVAQHLFGVQLRDTYFASMYVGWKF